MLIGRVVKFAVRGRYYIFRYSKLSMIQCTRFSTIGYSMRTIYPFCSHTGEVTCVHINTSSPEMDEQLSRSLNQCLVPRHRQCSDVCEKFLQCKGFEELCQNQIFILGAEPSRSIVVYLYFKSIQALQYLMHAVEDGRMENILEDILENVNCNYKKFEDGLFMIEEFRTSTSLNGISKSLTESKPLTVKSVTFDEDEESFCNTCINTNMHLDDNIESEFPVCISYLFEILFSCLFL